MTSKLGAAAAALVLAGALSLAAAGPAVERAAGVAPAAGHEWPDAGRQAEAAARRPGRRCRARRSSCRRSASLRRIRSEVRRLAVSDRLVDAGRRAPPSGSGQPPGAPAPGGPIPPAPPTVLPDYVSVTATEYRLALSRPLVGRGRVTVELRNKGEDPHDLVVTREGGDIPVLQFPETDPEVYTASAVDLATGRYRLFCSLPGHADLGMTASLRVE